MLAIDSDVFLIDCRYRSDAKYEVNHRFLEALADRQIERATTLFNVLEICGVLSFNLNRQQLRTFYAGFARRYGLRILAPQLPERFGYGMLDLLAGRALGVILRRVSFGDALAILTLESHPSVTALVTWNASHFAGKTKLDVWTPQEWMSGQGLSPPTTPPGSEPA